MVALVLHHPRLMANTNTMTNIDDPEAPGRGPSPRHMGALYRWERVNDLPIIGYFDGVVLGVRKGADTLLVGLLVGGGRVAVRYENLVAAIPADECPQCERMMLLRTKMTREWICQGCGYVETEGTVN